jgi:hypothetical protein
MDKQTVFFLGQTVGYTTAVLLMLLYALILKL